MKKMKRMLIGTLLVFTLCMLTACGNNNNAADEVPNTANDGIDNVGDGAAEDNLTDDADNNGNDDGNNGTDGNMAGDTAVPDDANTANDGTAVPFRFRRHWRGRGRLRRRCGRRRPGHRGRCRKCRGRCW